MLNYTMYRYDIQEISQHSGSEEFITLLLDYMSEHYALEAVALKYGYHICFYKNEKAWVSFDIHREVK